MATMPETCTTREAAKKLNVALSTIQTWVESGHLEAWKTPGGHRRIPLSSIDKLMQHGMALRAVDTPKPFRLLVVEDEEFLREIYQDTIKTWNLPVEVEVADNGYDGLVKAAANRPDLLVADLNMPEMDGFRMVRALRAEPATAEMPIVVVTGISEEEVREGGLPDDIEVLGKPIPFARLREIVEQLIARKGRFERISMEHAM